MRPAWLTPSRALDAFIVANVGFLGVDIVLAHAMNRFAHAAEWIPLGFSVVGALLVAPAVISTGLRERLRGVALLVGAGSILVGIAGMILHLESGFFERQTLRDLVYSAPFAAPLAYVGVGLLLVMTRMEQDGSVDMGRWVLLLTLGGFVGNLALSLLDHAQNGFFSSAEWLSVGASAFGCGFLFMAVMRSDDPTLLKTTLGLLGLEALVGVMGFLLHASANMERPGADLLDRFIFGAPVFAPLLFANLALLGALGIWILLGAKRMPARTG